MSIKVGVSKQIRGDFSLFCDKARRLKINDLTQQVYNLSSTSWMNTEWMISIDTTEINSLNGYVID